MAGLGRPTTWFKLLRLGTCANDNASVFENAFGIRPETVREFDVPMSIGKGGHDRGLGRAQACVVTHDVYNCVTHDVYDDKRL